MRSLYDFIVEPLGDKYSNKVKVGDKELIVNTKIEDFKFVNRLAKVLETPKAFNTGIEIVHLIVLHQNVFSVFYDLKGETKICRSWFKDDLHFCPIDYIYLYTIKEFCHSFGDLCFITPL